MRASFCLKPSQLISQIALVALALISIPNWASETHWTIDSLQGHSVSHDGPNCLDTALVALGYVDQLRFSGSFEMRFFTENYCRLEDKGLTKDHDLILVQRTDSEKGEDPLEHAAIDLGNNRIFEKLNAAGLYGYYAKASPYLSRLKGQSPYFTSNDMAQREFESFRCQPANLVRKSLAECQKVADKMGLTQIQTAIQNAVLNPQPRPDFDKDFSQPLMNLLSYLPQMKAEKECAIFLWTQTSSIQYQLRISSDEERKCSNLGLGCEPGEIGREMKINPDIQKLFDELQNWRQLILKDNHSEKTARIFLVPTDQARVENNPSPQIQR